MHRVVEERPLVHLASRGDPATVAMDLTFLEEALKHRTVRVRLESDSVLLQSIHVDLPPVFGSAPTVLKFRLHGALRVEIIIKLVVRVVIKRPQHLVNVLNRLVTDLIYYVVVVVEGELVIQLDDVAVQTLADVNRDFIECLFHLIFLENDFGLR